MSHLSRLNLNLDGEIIVRVKKTCTIIPIWVKI